MRRSTLLLKQELADSLGEDGKDYWIKLGEFLRGQCSKAELDSVGLQVFTAPYQVKIHNKLLLSILYNLTAPSIGKPEGVDREFVIKNHKRRKGQALMQGMVLKKRFNRKIVLSMPVDERNRLNADTFLTSHNQVAPNVSSSSSAPGTEPSDFPRSIESIPKSCVDDGDLPSLELLRSRISFTCSYLGIDASGFSDDVVHLIYQALENHLKNILTPILRKVSSSQSESISLNVKQLLFALHMSPSQRLVAESIEVASSTQN